MLINLSNTPLAASEHTVQVPVEQMQVPAGEFAVKCGSKVEATDGHVGKVDEFVINAKNSHITHLVMREGHLWGKKDVIIPVSAMGKTCDDTDFLNLDGWQVESLPAFPVHRRWVGSLFWIDQRVEK